MFLERIQTTRTKMETYVNEGKIRLFIPSIANCKQL